MYFIKILYLVQAVSKCLLAGRRNMNTPLTLPTGRCAAPDGRTGSYPTFLSISPQFVTN